MTDEQQAGDLTVAGTDALFQALYAELRSEAKRQRRKMSSLGAMQTTALVNESYFKLASSGEWTDRQHFLRTAASAMRQLLVDEARKTLADKRGAGAAHDSYNKTGFAEQIDDGSHEDPATIIAINNALGALADLNPRLAKVVECRYFAGYTEEETADMLDITTRTVRRDWLKARAYLFERLQTEAQTSAD
ncbi:sigma-70 family RNA polymerase sigma factor [bacterium]|nr:sigma-70 family RNA polymerase sigma factor [bacterium]